eukprot:GHRR01034646.1.p1 GENE.GHRR01034646.1~~GHRR01034646.1.p1  ORF type:complete len:141 (+),score=32.34 GHRR01034646.1:212-634(+)
MYGSHGQCAKRDKPSCSLFQLMQNYCRVFTCALLHVERHLFLCASQVASGLLQHFKGQAAELVKAATQSAVSLVQLLAAHFPGFRDHAVYKGRQVSAYGADSVRPGCSKAVFAAKWECPAGQAYPLPSPQSSLLLACGSD